MQSDLPTLEPITTPIRELNPTLWADDGPTYDCLVCDFLTRSERALVEHLASHAGLRRST